LIFFETVSWKNFLSTGNSPTTIDLCKNKLTMIVGENGNGKSTLLDAICYALYNKAFRNINKPQLINTVNKKDLLVEIGFSISKNKYKIIRGQRPNIFEVYKDGKLLNQDAANKDYQDSLEKNILKLSYKSFCQIVILGNASYVPFMQLSTGQRREIIEDLLDIQVFSKMNSLLKDHSNTLSKEIETNRFNIRLIREKLQLIEQHIQMAESKNKKYIEEQEIKIQETEISIGLNRNYIDQITEKLQNLKSLTGNHKKIQNKLSKMHSLNHQLNEKINKLQNETQFLEEHNNCPTCKQEINEDFKCTSITKKEEQIKKTQDGLNLLIEEIEKVNNEIEEINKINSEIAGYNIEIATKNMAIKGLEDYIATIKQELENTIVAKSNIEERKNKKQLQEDFNKEEERAKELAIDAEVIKTAANILKDGGIKARIIKQYIPIMNKLVNAYLASMDFYINFELDESFNEKIISRNREEFSYSSFSEGEKARINLSILFAWRSVAKMRNSACTNLLILDEIFDGPLDMNGTEEFAKILNDLAPDTNTFIISHKVDQMGDKFKNIIKFEKNKGFSRIAA
jgi:DNA repair exonuclease SbcCD ATPase subunit